MKSPTIKQKAISLRRAGRSYSEILEKIDVAKSTLSLWLRSVGLSKRQEQRLTNKKLLSARRGGEKRRRMRLEAIQELQKSAEQEVRDKDLDENELWLSGIMLYWAEGSKEKDHHVGQQTLFSNSDPRMIKLFLKWLKTVAGEVDQNMVYEIYIHHTANVMRALEFWSNIVSCNKAKIRVYFKRNKKSTNRKNVENNYYGLLRIRVKKSSMLNRRISSWISAICKHWEVV